MPTSFCSRDIVRTHIHTQQTDCITRTTKWSVISGSCTLYAWRWWPVSALSCFVSKVRHFARRQARGHHSLRNDVRLSWANSADDVAHHWHLMPGGSTVADSRSYVALRRPPRRPARADEPGNRRTSGSRSTRRQRRQWFMHKGREANSPWRTKRRADQRRGLDLCTRRHRRRYQLKRYHDISSRLYAVQYWVDWINNILWYV